MRPPKSKKFKQQIRLSEAKEIELLESWIASAKPDSGSNPLSLPPPPKAPSGTSFPPYAGAVKFTQLPLSRNTKKGLAQSKFYEMTDIQRASLPHSLCGRDILGAAKTGSGKTLAFVIPVLEKLYKARWGPEDGVGCIIMSPTRELAGQLFDVLKSVGTYHSFSAGLLIGGRQELDTEKERVNELNILVCTPGRLLQHMDETPNFECSQLQILVLDEADRILDSGFKKALNAIVSNLPKHRQTFLFSATQTKSVQDLARLSLKDPEYISVHEKADTATPTRLEQTALVVPLEEKLDMLWSFLKAHNHSRTLVFLTTCKQVKFVFEVFKKLRPGIPLKCLHGGMKQEVRMGIYEEFCKQQSVMFCTDVASRGLDFNKCVDWVVQVDCPEDVKCYIHRVGRTARYDSGGKSVLFLVDSEVKMLERLKDQNIPIHLNKANKKRLESISGRIAEKLVKFPELQQLAQRAFITYLNSIKYCSDKEVFDVSKLPIDKFWSSLGLPITPEISIKLTRKGVKLSKISTVNGSKLLKKLNSEEGELEVEDDLLIEKNNQQVSKESTTTTADAMGRFSKKKKVKINIDRPLGTRVVFDDEGNTLPPLAKLANINTSADFDKSKVSERFAYLREEMEAADKEDKALERKRLKEKRNKQKMKLKRARDEEDDDDNDDDSVSEEDEERNGRVKKGKNKTYFDNDSDDGEKVKNGGMSVTLAEQEELALKLLSSMNS